MPAIAIASPTLLTDPGFLFWAPIGSTLPANTVIASAFTDVWPAAWIALGMTDSGTDIDLSVSTSPILAAEVVEPLAWRTTNREGTVSFMLKNFTATNLARASNGAALTVTGTTTTTLTQIDPPVIGTETRAMIGFESLDSTFRFVAYQVFNDGGTKLSMNKAPANTNIPWVAKLEKPASTLAWRAWTAGVARG